MTQKDFGPPNGKSSHQSVGQGNVLREAKDVASHLMSEAKGEVTERASSQKTRAAESLHGVADALRGTKDQLDEKAPGFGLYADKAADAVENLSDYIRNQTVGDVLDKVEQFARREQALFVGGAIALGLLAGRFLKSGRRSSYGYEGQRGFRGDDQRNYQSSEYGGARDYRRDYERSYDRDWSAGSSSSYAAGSEGVGDDYGRGSYGSSAGFDSQKTSSDRAQDMEPGLDVSPGNEEQSTSRGPIGDYGGKKSGTGSSGDQGSGV